MALMSFDHYASLPPCPRCGGQLIRVRRHFADRLFSLFHPVRRYRCHKPDCLWEGTLRHPSRR
jgi:hypothetical protein